MNAFANDDSDDDDAPKKKAKKGAKGKEQQTKGKKKGGKAKDEDEPVEEEKVVEEAKNALDAKEEETKEAPAQEVKVESVTYPLTVVYCPSKRKLNLYISHYRMRTSSGVL